MLNLILLASFITLTFAISFAFENHGTVFAQNSSSSMQPQNDTSFPVNRTSASITDQPETLIVNQTTIPAIQSTIKVNQTIDPLQGQPQILQPLQNQSILPQTPNLSDIDNATIVKPTGPAITTIANKTIVPFNQTLIETENITNSPPQQQQQQNQSQGPLNQLGETVGNLIPG